MKDLELVKSFDFNGVNCDIYSKNNEVFMTSTQLGEALGYSEPRKAISKIIERNQYLKDKEFSGVVNLGTSSGIQNTSIKKWLRKLR